MIQNCSVPIADIATGFKANMEKTAGASYENYCPALINFCAQRQQCFVLILHKAGAAAT